MQSLLFATSNQHKFNMAQHLCTKAGITLEQAVFEIDEIQGEDPEIIVRDKAQKAYAEAGRPIIVSDDSWNFVGLGGFPGAYMKSINHWFSPQQFVDLMQHVENRQIILHQYLAFQDEFETVIFRRDISGQILREPRGVYGVPLVKVVALDSDNGLSIAEVYDKGLEHDPKRMEQHEDAWQDLIEWFIKKEEV